MGGYAWVTLATNNSYSLGALVLAHSLKKSNTAHKLAVLITPAVSQSMRDQLQTVFDVVKMVDVLDSKDEAHLALLKRPDLGITFTKIHCWRLIEFEKCVFLDADTLVVRNCDELFEREEFSAAPDVSWPDCFNSGVFVYRPSVETFNKLLQFAVENRSFDGGDQGLLNQFFSNWATEDIKKHLPFVYNLTSVAAYSYIPAFKHFGSETRIVHFIGTGKPWLQQLDIATRTVTPSSGSEHLAPLLQQWWDLFCEKVHPNLDKNLESNNVGMSHPSVEACSNSLAIALTDESQTPHLIEPCTPYRQKDDFRQYNLPYRPFDVKGSSGELLNVEFLLASVVPPAEQEVSSDEQQRRNGESLEEQNKTHWVDDEKTNWKPILEKKEPEILQNDSDREQEFIYEHDKSREDVCAIQQPEKTEERTDTSEEEQNLQQTEPPPPEDPFDYHSFFPDEICINNYLEQNVVTYQPFNSHHQHHDHHHHDYRGNDETDISHGNKESEKNIPCLPRFLTIPENDQRQSGNVDTHPPEQYHSESVPVLTACDTTLSVEKHEHSQKESTPQREEIQSERRESEPIPAKRELTKSKSMSHLVCDEPLWTPPRSIWKSQPDVNVDPNKKYSMPKLKPILPKQNSFSKCVSFVPKITLYTEFLMSSEYKDPVDLPHDKEGFVKTHIHKEAKLRRSKSSVDVQSKFGPLPYVLSPELDKPTTPKKTPLRLLDNELYDLTHCKRQLGNKPKSESSDRKKENAFSALPALKPIIPAKDQKSTLMKKRKLKELSPANGGREKIPKKEPKIKERKREVKPTPRNISTNSNGNGNNLDEILKKLREFSKDYQHFFGVVMDAKDNAVTCKNSAVQKTEPGNNDCSSSRELESLNAPVSNRVKATQVPKETRRESGLESTENDSVVRLKDKNYVKDQKKTNHLGSTNKQDISSQSNNEEREAFKTRIEKLELENRSDDLSLITIDAEGKQNAMSAKENASSKDKDKSSHPVKKYYTTCSHSGSPENGHVTRTPELLAQKPMKSADPVEKTESCVQCRTETESLSSEINLTNLTARCESSKVRVNDDIYWTTKSDSTQGSCCTSPSYASKTKAAIPKDSVSVHSSDQRIQQVVEDSESIKVPEGHKILCALSAEQSVNPEPLENKEMKKDEEIVDDHTAKCQSSNNELPQVPEQVASAGFNKSNGHLNTKFSVGVQSSGINSLKQEIEAHKCKNRTHSKKKVINEKDSETERPVKLSSDLNSKHLISTLEQPSQKGERSHPDEHCEDGSTSSGPYAATIQKTASSVVKSSPKFPHKEKSGHSVLQRNGAVKTKEESSSAVNYSKATTFVTKEEKVGKDVKKIRDVPDFEIPQSSYKTVASELIEESSTAAHVENPLLLGAPNSLSAVPREVRKPHSGSRNIPEKGCKNSEFFENRFEVLSNDFPDGTIRFVGKKTCDKKSERKTPSSPSPSTPNGGKAQPRNLEDLKSTAGIAGAIAQLSLEAGSEQNQESAVASAAHQEYLRRQNWETGNMDYMGRDSFDNIWLKICQTLETKDSEETAGSSKTPTETSAKTEEGEKPKEVAPAEKPVSLSAILQNSSEYIETLPSEQASGPIEDDEIIFSKPENRQSNLTNIVEEEEVSMEVPERVAELITENLKPLQIPQPNTGVDEMGTSVTEIPSKCPKPQEELSPEKPKASEAKETVAKEEEAKIIAGASGAGEEKTSLGSPAAIVTEVKTQPQTEKEECKIPTADQPPASSQEQLPTDEQKQSETLAEDKEDASKPAEKAEECKVVAIPSPPIVYPGAPFTEKDKTSKRLKTEGKPDVFSEPIPLPPPESPTAAPTQEPPAKNLKPDSSKGNGKPKKGVFTKILEMVGVSPKEKTENELSKSVFYNVEGGVSSPEETDVTEKQVPMETKEPPAVAEPKQSDDVKEAKQQPAEEVKPEKAAPPEESTKTKELLPSKQEEIASKTTADSDVALDAPEVKASIETQEQKPLELKQSEKSEERKPHPKESDKKGGSKSKSQNEQKSGQESISKPARNSGSKEPKQSTESKQSAAKRKSPNRKLTMPQKPPETEVTTPTPPPQPDVPPRRNSALLKVDDTIPETPPVPELSEKKADETVEGKVMTEIDDIIGKAKSEVESLLQDRRSAEKEAGESSDLINTMKLIMGDETPVKTTTPEEVEELRVTTEEERKRHKEEVVSSKLSDQILKAIPPPRRKAISEASASTSAIPKAPAAPEQKNPPGESKSKSSKPSSIPVPPPRNRGKPTPPPPSKGKGKK